MPKVPRYACIGLLFLASACASTPKLSPAQTTAYINWYKEIGAKIEPVWKNAVKLSIKKNIKSAEEARRFKAALPDLYTRLEVDVGSDGKVVAINKIHESKYAFLDEAAVGAINSSIPLPAPPDSILKNKVARLTWQFKFAK